MAELRLRHKISQIILVILNFFIFLCGLTLIVAGSIAIVNIDSYAERSSSTFDAFMIFMICIGCLLFLLGFIGLWGACRKSVRTLILYAILLGLIALTEIACGIAGFILRDEVEELLREGWNDALKLYKNNPHIREVMGKIESKFGCCGVTSANDYISLGIQIPDTCRGRGDNPGRKPGCLNALKEFVQNYIVAIAIFGFVFAILQACCIIMAVCVLQAIQSKEAK